MSTLLMRLAAPLQSWGGMDKFERRGTERVPTKSGVVGLAAAALGRRRNEKIDDLSALRFGVRVDRGGILLRDYHTVKSRKSTYVTTRYYLSDAIFLVGLEGEDAFLDQIDYALQHPEFPLFLGRRSCPPEGRLSLGIREGRTLLEALREEPWLVQEWMRKKEDAEVCLPILMDAENEAADYVQRDLPLSFDQAHREYGFRRVSGSDSIYISNPYGKTIASRNTTEQDPLIELGEE